MQATKKAIRVQAITELMPWVIPTVGDDTSAKNKAKSSQLGYLIAVLVVGFILLLIVLWG